MKNKSQKFVILIIIFFTFLYSFSALISLIDIWFNTAFLIPIDIINAANKSIFVSFLSCILGSMLGASILSITSLHRHIKTFDMTLSIGYFLNPLLAILLGVLAFCLVQASFIFLSGTEINLNKVEKPPYGFAVFGFIFGYNWNIAISILDKLSTKLQISSN